jgi:protoheme ferro-lyase
MQDAPHFTTLTKRKATEFTFQKRREKCSKRHVKHLDNISQFMTDIRYISIQDNIVDNKLFRICLQACQTPDEYKVLSYTPS